MSKMLSPSTGLLEENNNNNNNNNNNFGAEQRNYADSDGTVSFSVLRRLDKQFQDIMLAVHQVWGPKLVEMEGRIMKLELAVDKLLASVKSNNEPYTNNSRQRCLYLQFTDKVSSPIWTGDEIKGKGGYNIEVVLKDETGKVVDLGPEASAELKIVAHKEDVNDNGEDATESGHFTNDIAGNQKAKRPILVGDAQLKLSKGIGILANIRFRKSSSHMSGVFKLEARAVDGFDGRVIKEARTEPFVVKDYRGKYSRKHYPPSLSDDICHLDYIGKAISLCLKQHGISTVKDFLIQLLRDSDRLKCLVRLPPKKWEATVEHALTCQLDKKVYCSVNFEEKKGVVFNLVGKVLGLILELNYVPFNYLSDDAKADASKIEIANIVQKDGMVPFDSEAALLQRFPQPVNPLYPSNNSRMDNTIDYENGVSHQMNSISLQDVASSSNVTEGTSVNIFQNLEENFFSFSDGPAGMEHDLDQQFINLECLWNDSDNNQTPSIDDMLTESPSVADYEVKKNLFAFFTVSKWLLQLERMATCDGNDNQKKRKVETE